MWGDAVQRYVSTCARNPPSPPPPPPEPKGACKIFLQQTSKQIQKTVAEVKGFDELVENMRASRNLAQQLLGCLQKEYDVANESDELCFSLAKAFPDVLLRASFITNHNELKRKSEIVRDMANDLAGACANK
eukprot:TRINITY_DN8833_c0_g1_i2.p1 TRINITY_DN8833_c0_g1~~TRINITY_DN8833_c0_g1_i2.p1  ORF type:complete len:132 (-),score=22.46 TRINITY_DN8833_c0_g1_i2:184-579(-)